MSTSTTKTETTPVAVVADESSRLNAYVELTKMRITIMVLVTFVVAAALSATGFPDLKLMFFGSIGMLFVAASGNAMNMYVERYSDILMPRTAGRPLPAQRLEASEVAIFGAATIGIGTAILLVMVNWQTAVCGLANWVLYVAIYTPMKRKTWLNTEVGAIAGAMPILMGSLATTGTETNAPTITFSAWVFFAVLVLWQFPHFMAIAWKYRHQYEAGGLKMLTVVDPSGRRAGRKSVVTAVLLIAVSVLPAIELQTIYHSVFLIAGAVYLGWIYLKASIAFNNQPNDATARTLMMKSLVYLPTYMLVLILAYLIRF